VPESHAVGTRTICQFVMITATIAIQL